MKMKKKCMGILLVAAALSVNLLGCGVKAKEEDKDNVLSDNIIITETGEVLQKEQPQPMEQQQQSQRTGGDKGQVPRLHRSRWRKQRRLPHRRS